MSVERISDAYALAAKMHRSQKDKQGKPYLYHCHHVAAQVRSLGADYEIVGVLHDAVEDTACTLEEVEALFGSEVRDGVDAMTIRDGEDYFSEYLQRVHANPIAKAVKIADATHNYERAVQFNDAEKQQRFQNKYRQVLSFLGAEAPQGDENSE